MICLWGNVLRLWKHPVAQLHFTKRFSIHWGSSPKSMTNGDFLSPPFPACFLVGVPLCRRALPSPLPCGIPLTLHHHPAGFELLPHFIDEAAEVEGTSFICQVAELGFKLRPFSCRTSHHGPLQSSRFWGFFSEDLALSREWGSGRDCPLPVEFL